MSDWTAGYVADVGYTYGCYHELNPMRIKLAFLNAGLHFPEVGAACELGFGQGVSVNMHAAASVTEWYGTDFNPAQAGFAQELAAASGSGAQLFDDAFAEFCARTDMPEFDFIGLHGIWSWISEENRAVIVNFVRRKLKLGGVLYISYNTQPGWAATIPLRTLMREHAEVMGCASDGTVKRIDSALEFATRLLKVEPIYARANPQVAERLRQLQPQSRNYLAHEYFNRDWNPMAFSDLARCLSDAKLNYACSAHYFDHVDILNLTGEQQMFLGEIADPVFRETVRDFMVNQQFRRDYWVRGARRLNGIEQQIKLRAQRVMLITHRSDISLKVKAAFGEAELSGDVYTPLLDLLAQHQIMTLGEIEKKFAPQNIGLGKLLQAVIVMMGAGHMAVAQDESTVQKVKKNTDRLNRYMLSKAYGSGDIAYLASPVTGGGVAVGRFHQLFIEAIRSGMSKPDEWASYVWQVISSQGQLIQKEGKTLSTAEENLNELTRQANEFGQKRLPILKSLQIT